jgi:hypothetical protein
MRNTIQHRSCISGRLLLGASALALAVVLGPAFAAMPSAQPQGHSAGRAPAAGSGTAVHSGPGVRTGFPLRGGRPFRPRSRFWGYPYWDAYWDQYWYSPYLFDDYDDYDSERTTQTPAPQVVVVEGAQASPETPAPKPPESLLLELQGDQWVRVTSYSQSPAGAQAAQPESQPASSPPSVTPRSSAAEPLREVPPAVLVYRDGHREEVKDYTIIGPTLYTSADYWSSGSWTRKVQMAQLDIPATLKINQERGVKFSLPSGPGEIVVRP